MKHTVTAFLLLLSSALLLGSDLGTIKGKLTDASSGDPMGYANIVVQGTSLGAVTNESGEFLIQDVPVGEYTVLVSFIGYKTIHHKGVHVKKGVATVLNFMMEAEKIIGEEVIVSASRPVENFDMMSFMSIPRTGKRRPSAKSVSMLKVNGAVDFNTEEYTRINTSGFSEVLMNPLSTFAADVDASSYSNARRFIMQDRQPPKDAVRIEEFINYFDYDYPEPEGKVPLSIYLEYGNCPWNAESKLVHIGIRGESLPESDRAASNLVFLIDVSGSMRSSDKLELLKKAFRLLVDQLDKDDRVSIVVYAGAAGEVLPSTSGANKKKIKDAIHSLRAGGSTAGGEGIQLAYKIAKKNMIKGGNNRVILATDGDFNVGISSTSDLVRFIEKKRDHGIFLTVLGFGQGNYKDNRLQELADRGNGTHAYIDNIMEAKKVLVDEINATLYTIAKDVKFQVEFNPAKVHSYRLLGYENRRLPDKDFEDDKKDAGEVGAGHTVTALYEIIPTGVGDQQSTRDLKYTESKIKTSAKSSDELLTVRIRYKEPSGSKSKEITEVLRGSPASIQQSSSNFRFSAAVAQYAQILRDSEYKGDMDLEAVLTLAKSAKGKDEYGYRAEFIELINRSMLMEQSEN